MKLAIAAAIAGVAVGVSAAFAKEKMTEAQLDQVYAGAFDPKTAVVMRVGNLEHNTEVIALPPAAITGGEHANIGKKVGIPSSLIHPGNIESRRSTK